MVGLVYSLVYYQIDYWVGQQLLIYQEDCWNTFMMSNVNDDYELRIQATIGQHILIDISKRDYKWPTSAETGRSKIAYTITEDD